MTKLYDIIKHFSTTLLVYDTNHKMILLINLVKKSLGQYRGNVIAYYYCCGYYYGTPPPQYDVENAIIPLSSIIVKWQTTKYWPVHAFMGW
jgi:hypothetical protein